MSARARFRIFLSSTSEDLTEHRARVAEAIEGLELLPGRMETFGARPKAPLEACRKEVAKADALVVVLAHRYGWVPGTDKGGDGETSITWHEVAAALDAKKPVFAFVVDEAYAWPGDKEQDQITAETSDAEALRILASVRGLKRFKDYLGDEVTLQAFTTPDDLAAKVTGSLSNWLLGLQDDAPEEPVEREEPRKVPEDPEIAAYRAWADSRYRRLDLIGVGGGDVRLRLDEIYVPLRISRRAEIDLDRRGGKRRAETAWDQAEIDLEVEQIFTAAGRGRPHAVVFGEPGSGKTTALKKLHQQCLADPEALGLPAGTLPVFVPLRRLAEGDQSEPLSVLVGTVLDVVSGGRLPSGLAERLWRHGRLLLLLDGLDEIADDTRRAEVAAYLDWQLGSGGGKGIRAVVSCRYSGYGGGVELGEGFLHLDVRPLDAGQVRRLVRLWFREVQPAVAGMTAEEARERAASLNAALEGESYASQRLKVLVSTPLLLTLLCLIVQRGGVMPRQRVDFYDQCLRVLLGRWGETTRGAQPLLDVESALAVLRPLAWRLHDAERRDDLSHAELVNHLRKRLLDLGQDASPFRVFEWLHRETGVIEEYAPRRYGFVHLGFQEYLAAAHAAARGEQHLDRLASAFGERWWREVVLLLVGLPGHRVFGPFMERLLRSGALSEQADLLRQCLAEAPEVHLEPFLAALDKGEPDLQAAVLRLLRGRCDPRLVERAERLAESPSAEVAAIAGRVVEQCREAPEGETDAGYDLFLAHHPAVADAAGELAASLSARGVRLYESPDWERDLEALLAGTRAVAVLVGSEGVPWQRPDLEGCIGMFHGEERPVVPVLLPGAGDAPVLPESVEWAAWVDLSDGFDAAGCEALESAALGPVSAVDLVPEVAAASLSVTAGPEPGEPLTDPVTGARFLWVPGGRFQLGEDASPHDDEKPAHWVRVSPFWLGETPVTNRQYAAFLEETGHEEPQYWRDRRYSGEEQPVVGATWHDANQYCEWLSGKLGSVAMLPSEAQWELAARGDDGRRFPWGDDEPNDTLACFKAKQPAPVGSFPDGSGPFGMLDQAGNVWEWCRDAWSTTIYAERAKKGNEPLDPVGDEGEGDVRVLRGGGWNYPAGSLRAAYRRRSSASYRYSSIGFRVLVVPASP
ncbi:MAG: SUMF1/EgtB/PvdO family nonheme iron enzyme [bacterium]|nr:SUMF1/EgtB/PvdO family nonheme iron enzyme [bacterium]